MRRERETNNLYYGVEKKKKKKKKKAVLFSLPPDRNERAGAGARQKDAVPPPPLLLPDECLSSVPGLGNIHILIPLSPGLIEVPVKLKLPGLKYLVRSKNIST